MRHLVLLSACIILGGPSAASAAPAVVVQTPNAKTTSTGEGCQRSDVILAQPREAPRARKLAELPPGDLVLAVLRGTKGCYVPVIVRKGYGGPEFNESPEGKAPQPVKIQPRRD